MNWTKSVDGELRTAIIVRHRIDLRTLIDCALYVVRNDADPQPPTTRENWYLAAKQALRMDGSNVWASIEETPDALRVKFSKQAIAMFPRAVTAALLHEIERLEGNGNA